MNHVTKKKKKSGKNHSILNNHFIARKIYEILFLGTYNTYFSYIFVSARLKFFMIINKGNSQACLASGWGVASHFYVVRVLFCYMKEIPQGARVDLHVVFLRCFNYR
jgi:hypothetical protein